MSLVLVTDNGKRVTGDGLPAVARSAKAGRYILCLAPLRAWGEDMAKMGAARAVLETLLRERKLDVTLTSERPWVDPEDTAPTGVAEIDRALGGGLRRGHLSEVVGRRSSGRTTVMCAAVAAATGRGEVVAVIDTCDRFDPASAAEAGVDLSRVLWVREHGDAARALKAMNLVLQAGGFGLVVFDLADMPALALRQFPYTTWMRISRVIEGSQTTAVLMGNDRIARSPGGVTISLEATGPRGTWAGHSDRARFLQRLDITPRVIHAHAPPAGSGVTARGPSHVERVSARDVARRTAHASLSEP